jgi:hypothetical protein
LPSLFDGVASPLNSVVLLIAAVHDAAQLAAFTLKLLQMLLASQEGI